MAEADRQPHPRGFPLDFGFGELPVFFPGLALGLGLEGPPTAGSLAVGLATGVGEGSAGEAAEDGVLAPPGSALGAACEGEGAGVLEDPAA